MITYPIFSYSLPAQIKFDFPIISIEHAEYLITYDHTYQLDSTYDFKRSSDMLLFVGKNSSKFISEEWFRVDTIMRKIVNMQEFNQLNMNPNKPIPRRRYTIWKNYPEKGKLTFVGSAMDTFEYTESLNLFNWKLLSDTDTLQGYPVQKATCKFGGRKWEAWFTTEIPYNDGPYKFNGLPGLIIKVFDNKHNYVFEMVKIEKIESEMMIDKVEKDYIIKTTKKGFQRARKNFWGNIDIRAKEAGLGRKVQKHVLRVASQRNNPIELLPE